MKPLVFYFEFTNFENESTTSYGFVIHDANFIKDFDDFIEVVYEDIAEELESNYGVHDWSTAPCDEVHAIGFTSYEVKESERLNLMNAWKNYFLTLTSEDNISSVCQIAIDQNQHQSDFDIYKQVLAVCQPTNDDTSLSI